MVDRYTVKREFLIKLLKYYDNYMIRKIVNRMSTNMTLKQKSIEGLIKLPPSISSLNLNDYLEYKSEDETIMRFMHTLQTKLAHCDLSAFYERIQTLEIEEGDLDLREKLRKKTGIICNGFYNHYRNKMILFSFLEKDKKKVEDTKTHELLHMASSRNGRNLEVCGFERIDYATGLTFGTGLNEGYTEYLNVKYFARNVRNSYSNLREITGKIGRIIGQKKMEQFYFSNDTGGLINELEKYASRDKIIEIIKKMDMVCRPAKTKEIISENTKLLNELRVDVANIALEKYKQQYNSNKIPEAGFKNAVYDLELFINGVEPIFYPNEKDNNGPPDKIYLSTEFLKKSPIGEISYQEYIDNINNYYDSLQGKIGFTYEKWTDRNGKKTIDYLNEKNEEYVKSISKKTKQIEMTQMFEEESKKEITPDIQQTSNKIVNFSELKQMITEGEKQNSHQAENNSLQRKAS